MDMLSLPRLTRRIAAANNTHATNILDVAITRPMGTTNSNTEIKFSIKRQAGSFVAIMDLSLFDVYSVNEGVQNRALDKRLEIPV